MLIPLITPQTSEVLNLAQMVRLHVVRTETEGGDNGSEIELYMADGSKRIYTGQAARIVNAEIHFALNTYRQMQLAAQSPLVAADGTSPARVM